MAPSSSTRSESSTTPARPKGWPPSLPYLSRPRYSPSLTPTHRAALRTRPSPSSSPSSPSAATPTPEIPHHVPLGAAAAVRIQPIPTASSHPASGQRGLFAAKHLAPSTIIVAYVGEVHAGSGSLDNDKDRLESDYDLWLDREAGLAVDAAKCGNEARFVNDYRGVAPAPNAEFVEAWDARLGERCMAVRVLPEAKSGKGKGGIRKGDEILVNYGKGFWGSRRTERDEHERTQKTGKANP